MVLNFLLANKDYLMLWTSRIMNSYFILFLFVNFYFFLIKILALEPFVLFRYVLPL